MSRCRWKACAETCNTPEALFTHLCDVHYATLTVRCERRHFFACEWKACCELVPCPGSKGETLLCAVKGHLLDHAAYRPKSLGALTRTLKTSGYVSSPSDVPANDTATAVVVPTPTATPPPHIRVPRPLPPLYLRLNSPAPPILDVYVPYSHSDAAARPRSSIVTPRVGRTISPTFDLPPPLVQSPRPPGVTISAPRTVSPTSEFPPPLVHFPVVGFATWKCKWSACTINLPVPFANAEDLLAHVLEVHVRPRSPDTPRNTVSVTDTTGFGRTRTYRKVTCEWSECNAEVVIRAKYVAHFEGHILADCELEQLERLGSTSPVRLTSVPLIPSTPTGTTPTLTPTPRRPRGRPRKADLKPDGDAETETDARPLKKRLRGNDAIDVDVDKATIVVKWGGSGGLPAPLPGSEVQPPSLQLEPQAPQAPTSQLSPSEIEREPIGSPRGSTTDSEEDEELDWSLS